MSISELTPTYLPDARVDVNLMPESTLIPSEGLWILPLMLSTSLRENVWHAKLEKVKGRKIRKRLRSEIKNHRIRKTVGQVPIKARKNIIKKEKKEARKQNRIEMSKTQYKKRKKEKRLIIEEKRQKRIKYNIERKMGKRIYM
jgi:hypothetical protein